jgi:hypothetical protein
MVCYYITVKIVEKCLYRYTTGILYKYRYCLPTSCRYYKRDTGSFKLVWYFPERGWVHL